MENEVRYSYATIQMPILKWVGMIIGFGTPPVHTKIYWRYNDQCWMTELTSDPAGPNCEDVGIGDGYTIQITKVPDLIGTKVECPKIDMIEGFARAYASTKNGDLSALPYDRDWYCDPQGYGGPMYDRCTSNTYASWILRHTGSAMPEKPKGAIGWDSAPLFPGPHHRDRL